MYDIVIGLGEMFWVSCQESCTGFNLASASGAQKGIFVPIVIECS